MENKPVLKVVKIGGGIIEDKAMLNSFLKSFSAIKENKILVHGGGKSATGLADKLGIKTQMHNGRRITNKEMLEVAIMAYAGLVNKKIVAGLQAYSCDAIGFTGADANLVQAVKRPLQNIDYGFAGDIVNIKNKFIKNILNLNSTPVFCPITHDAKGQLLNTNADSIASEIARVMTIGYQVELYYCFTKNGVLKDIHDENSIIENISFQDYQKLLEGKILTNGMLPKIQNAFYALQNKVSKVKIGDVNIINKYNPSVGTNITL